MRFCVIRQPVIYVLSDDDASIGGLLDYVFVHNII